MDCDNFYLFHNFVLLRSSSTVLLAISSQEHFLIQLLCFLFFSFWGNWRILWYLWSEILGENTFCYSESANVCTYKPFWWEEGRDAWHTAMISLLHCAEAFIPVLILTVISTMYQTASESAWAHIFLILMSSLQRWNRCLIHLCVEWRSAMCNPDISKEFQCDVCACCRKWDIWT